MFSVLSATPVPAAQGRRADANDHSGTLVPHFSVADSLRCDLKASSHRELSTKFPLHYGCMGIAFRMCTNNYRTVYTFSWRPFSFSCAIQFWPREELFALGLLSLFSSPLPPTYMSRSKMWAMQFSTGYVCDSGNGNVHLWCSSIPCVRKYVGFSTPACVGLLLPQSKLCRLFTGVRKALRRKITKDTKCMKLYEWRNDSLHSSNDAMIVYTVRMTQW